MRLELLQLRLKRAFNLSQASAETKKTLIARFGDGIGEGSSSIFYGVSSEDNLKLTRELMVDPKREWSAEELDEFARSLPSALNVARCAIAMALLDHNAKQSRQSLWEYLALSHPGEVSSCFTVTTGTEDDLKRQMEAVAEFRAIKLKVGFAEDLKFIDAVLRLRPVRLRLDANGGWTRDETVERLRALAGYPIDFIEQPITDPAVRELDYIKTKVDCMLVLDESIKSEDDIKRYRAVMDGINLKLSKCGGVENCVTLARLAQGYNVKRMLGCMIESAVGITAALHLASLFDYLDLDAILLTENDPFWGATFNGDRMLLPSGAGIGLNARENALA